MFGGEQYFKLAEGFARFGELMLQLLDLNGDSVITG